MSLGREKSARRSRLCRLLTGWSSRPNRGEHLRLESLEKRQLLAGDVGAGDLMTDPIALESVIAPVSTTGVAAQSGLTAVSEGEGEPAPDLVQFARDLASAGAVFYGAHWCPACTEQKQLFDDGADDLPFVEVTNPDRSIGQIGIDNNITAYPTWVFPDNTRATGVLSLQELSNRSGVTIAQSETPSFEEVGNQTALIGSPLHIPIDAYDPDGEALTVTVSVENPNLLDATVITGNRSIRIDMATYGDMIFELFEQRAPRATGRVIELAEADFYDDIIFHRVIDDFVIQGGDPTATGTGGSNLGDFDDDFHPDLQHNRSGVLSFAKSADDTNDSQFFITEVPTRFLDFNHSVFGQLIEGEDVRDAISEHAVNSADRPTTDIAINTIEVFNDSENSLIMLKPTGTAVGSTNVTVRVTDSDGNFSEETFQVDVNNDTANSQPFLNEVTVPNPFTAGTPATLQLSSTDVEGDAVQYSAQIAAGSSGSGATASITQAGLLTVTPPSGFTGDVNVDVTVRPGPGVTGNASSDRDTQRLTFTFEADAAPAAPASIDLLAASDTGASDTDNITNATSLSFQVDGVVDGATVQLINTQTSAVVGQGVASGTSITITTNNFNALGDGDYSVAARQISNGQTSPISGAITLTFDTTDPVSVAGSANTRGNVGRPYQSDLISNEEGTVVYAIASGPAGATINSGSGVIDWNPTAADIGANSFTVTLTDLAGNVQTDGFTVTVSEAPTAEVKLVVRDTSGNEVSSLNVGDSFFLELVGVDARDAADQDGVFAIYADVLFDSSIVRPASGATIEYVGDFNLSPKGTFLTGLIDELGAASTRTSASNVGESLVARVPMQAIAAGSVNIRSEEADEASSEILLFGNDNQISADAVFFGGVNLSVGLDFALNDDTATVAEDSGATTIDVLANDTTTGSATLSVISVSQPASGGTVSVSNGVVSFTPEADFAGTTEFTYTAGSGTGAQATAAVTVTVTPVNDPPTAVGDTFNVVEGSSVNSLDVLANDLISPDTGETLTVTAVDGTSSSGTVTIASGASSIDYTPAAGFSGTDTFTYTVSDGQLTSTASVTVTVAPADAPPTAVDDSFTVNEDTAEASFDVMANDTRDTDNQTFVLDSVAAPSEGGSARISGDGSTFFYEPAADFFGTETVTYTIRDTGGGLSAGTVTFTVTPINDPPPVLNPTFQLNRGSGETVVIDLADLPENVDGDSETISLANVGTPTAGGTATVDADGNLRYTPPSSTFSGTDTVTYEVSDGSGTNSTGTVTIVINDFVTRSIRVNFSGTQGHSLSAATRLVGTDALGNAVDVTSTIDGDNDLIFDELLPGDYVVEIPAVPFFSGGESPQRIAISSAAADGDAVVQASMGRLRPEFLSIQDWLGSTPAQSILVVVEPGAAAVVADPTPSAQETIAEPNVTLNDAGTQLTINGKDDADADITASVLTNRRDAVITRGQISNMRLYRVNVDSSVVPFQSSTSSAGAAAAGTQLAGSSNNGSDTNGAESLDDLLAASGSGEGEGIAIGTSAAEVAAPLLSLESLDESDRSDVGVSVEAEVTPAVATRRRFTASTTSSRVGVTSAPRSPQMADGLSQVDLGDSLESSSLSPSRVDRFFRRGR